MNDQLIKIYSTFPSLSCAPLTQWGQNVYELNHLIITFMSSQEILNTLSSINDRAAGIPRGREFQVKKNALSLVLRVFFI